MSNTKSKNKMTSKKIPLYNLLSFLVTLMLFSACTHHAPSNYAAFPSSLWGNDPKGAEVIYKQDMVKPTDKAFETIHQKYNDGSEYVTIVHNQFANTAYHALYSPHGNLRLIAAGCSEMADIYGYLIDYTPNGKVEKITLLNPLGDMVEDGFEKLTPKTANKWFKQWTENPKSKKYSYDVKRDSTGAITSIGDVITRDNYKSKLYIREWGPFWTNDLHGGSLGIFVLQEYQGDKSGSYVNYLYQDNHLIAELAYWKGTYIKARTYNRYGSIVRQYEDRSINIEEQAFWDFTEEPKWYVN